MRLNKLGAFLFAGALLAVGCGDSTEETPDGGVDGGEPDADMTADAAPPATYGGTIAFYELKAPAAANGQGTSGVLEFAQNGTGAATVLVDQTGGSPFGCKLTERDIATQPSSTKLDEGTIAFTVANTDGSITPATIPTCSFDAVSGGYLCPGPFTGMDGALGAGVGPMASVTKTITSTSTTFTSAVVGRYVKLGAPLSTDMPVVGMVSANTILVYDGGAAGAAVGATGITFQDYALKGPIPASAGIINDTDTVDVTFTPGPEGHFEGFTKTGMKVGDMPTGFTVSDVDTTPTGTDPDILTTLGTSLTDLPTFGTIADGHKVRVTCDNCVGGGAGANGLVFVLQVDVSDTTPTASPLSFPAATTKSWGLRCVAIGSGSVDMDKTLYQTFIDNIQADGGKRVRVTGIWSDLYQPAQPDGNSINVIAGQGWVEFANVDTM